MKSFLSIKKSSHSDRFIEYLILAIALGTSSNIILGNPSYERELYAVIKDLTDGSTFEAHSGSLIKDYEVLDIESSKVIIVRNQKRYTLSLTKKR